MTNEYGIRLDRNGYAPSIVPGHSKICCWWCHKNGVRDPLNRHEVFGGPYRAKSKRLGLWVYLCHSSCHQGPGGVHNNRDLDMWLKKDAEVAALNEYGWSRQDFIREFGRDYLP